MKNEALFQTLYLEAITECLVKVLGIKIYFTLANHTVESRAGYDAVLFTDPFAVGKDGAILDASKVIALFQFKDSEYSPLGREFEIPATGLESQYVHLLEQATQIPNVFYILNLIDVPPILHAIKENIIDAALALPVESINLFAGPTANFRILFDGSRSACFIRRGSSNIFARLPQPFVGAKLINAICMRMCRKGSWRATMMLEKIKSSEMGRHSLDVLFSQGFELRRGDGSLILQARSKPAAALEQGPHESPSFIPLGLQNLLTGPTVRIVECPDGSRLTYRRTGFNILRRPRRRKRLRLHIWRGEPLVHTDTTGSKEKAERESSAEPLKIPWPEGPVQVPDLFLQPPSVTDEIQEESDGETGINQWAYEPGEWPNPYLPPNHYLPEESSNTPSTPPEQPLSWSESYNRYLDDIIRENVVNHPNTAVNTILFKFGFNFLRNILGLSN